VVVSAAHSGPSGDPTTLQLVQVVDVLHGDVLDAAGHRHEVEGGQVLDQLAQADTTGVRNTGTPNFAASSSTATTSLTLPSRQASTGRTRATSLASDVAPRIGLRRHLRPWVDGLTL
jgi:hypothetical protein